MFDEMNMKVTSLWKWRSKSLS